MKPFRLKSLAEAGPCYSRDVQGKKKKDAWIKLELEQIKTDFAKKKKKTRNGIPAISR